ncbi:RNase H family protein, partial [Leucobacter sp. M11]|uniref:RNase H family protein n=1 Tax=Leucobacter sp. M11 TaxID=2993565 RepID=UPI002D7F97D5
KPVLNRDLLEELDAALVGRTARFEWVKGHANHPLNEAADDRARAVAEAYQRGTPIPSGPGFVRAGDPPAPGTTPSASDTEPGGSAPEQPSLF